ncbi:MAG: site-specific integrase [Planctomycetota bacterium]
MANKLTTKPVPAYRLHKPSSQAIVTLRDSNRGHRRDFYLGPYGTPESRKLYRDTLEQWEQDGRTLDGLPDIRPRAAFAQSVGGVALDYWLFIKDRYGNPDELPSHARDIRTTMRLLRSACGKSPAGEFGPLRLAEIRETMVGLGWSRSTINKRAAFIKAAFRHAVARELVPSSVLVALDALGNLPHGYKNLREPERVLPVPADHIDIVLPHLSSPVRGIVQVMRYTGARCGEVIQLRPANLDTTGPIWRAEIHHHKNTWRGKSRTIWFGPKAKSALAPFLNRELTAPLFSPAEAEAEMRAKRRASRTTSESSGNRPGTNRQDSPERKPGTAYTTSSVRRAITRACDKAGIPAWTPHRLRHTAATEIRRAAGLESAAVVLGHGSATLTDAIYAERDEATAAKVLGIIG